MSHEIRIVRRLNASSQEVYEAWTSPELLVQWMLPMPDCQTEAQLDVRVGGEFRIVMVAHGKTYPHRGEYLSLTPPKLIEFTWISEATLGRRSLVRVEIEALSSETCELTLVQRELPTDVAAQEHRQGWSCALDELARLP